MTPKQNTFQAGNRAGSANANGHNGHDHARGDDGPRAVWSPGVMLGHELDADRDETIRDVVDADAWEALRAFKRRLDIELTAETTFAELDAVPPQVWDACGLEPPTVRAVATFVAEYAYPLPDPQEAGERLKTARAQRYRERDYAARQLKPEGIATTNEYALSEVERVCGADVADVARQRIDQANRDIWNMGAAARKQRREERNYLATAAELVVKLNVPADRVASMESATPEQRSAAWADLADVRALHRAGGVADHDPVSRRWCTLDDLDNLASTHWLVAKVLPASSLTHLIGMSQSLKSFIALDIALSVATGTPFAGSSQFGVAARGQVIYVVAEGVQGIGKRIRAWCQQRGIDRNKVLPNFTLLKGGAQLASRRDMADVTAKATETGACLVILDTQARCTVDLEENSATDQGRAIARLDALMQRTGAAVLVLHHTTKTDPRNARGSVAWKGAVDAELIALRHSKDALDVTIEVGKMKDDANNGQYRLKAATVALSGGDTSLVIAPGADPLTIDPNTPIDQWTGNGAAFAKAMYTLAQQNCIPGEGRTQSSLADIANEVVGTTTDLNGRTRQKRRVCSRQTATAAVKLLVEHEWLVVAKRDYLRHVYYEPKDYPPPNPADVSDLNG